MGNIILIFEVVFFDDSIVNHKGSSSLQELPSPYICVFMDNKAVATIIQL